MTTLAERATAEPAHDLPRTLIGASLDAVTLAQLLADARWFVPEGSTLAARIDRALNR